VVSVTPRPRFTPGKGHHVLIRQEAGWASRAGLDTETRGKTVCLCQGSNPGRSVCSQTLNWRSYPASQGRPWEAKSLRRSRNFSCLWTLKAHRRLDMGSSSPQRPYLMNKPNVVVEWLTFLLRTREVPGVNIGLETGYPNWGFSWFASFPPDECWDSTLKLGHDRFLPNPFQFTIQLSPFHSMPCSLSYRKRRSQINYKLNKFMKTYPCHPRLGLPMHVFCSFFSQSRSMCA
jgi:hypothetical protein